MPPQCRCRQQRLSQSVPTKVTCSVVCLNDPSADVLSELQKVLETRNSLGLRSSFDVQSNRWVEFLPPQTPTCPHALNPYRTEDDCYMRIHKDAIRSYWKAEGHVCNFIVLDFASDRYKVPRHGQQKPYFSRAVAIRRATSNKKLIETVEWHYENGIYNCHPEMHPINMQLLPHYMAWYTSAKAVQANLQFFDSPIGQHICLLLSSAGLVPASLYRLLHENKQCPACHCAFSIDGFNTHLDYDGTCRNWHERILGKSIYVSICSPLISSTLVMPAQTVKCNGDRQRLNIPIIDSPNLWSPLGVAWHEWNSRVGVPQDVWAVISTGNVHYTKAVSPISRPTQ
ncbi:hypothetical protein IW261DRAFT_1559018 [Armillaria novae-zelandiae]|uniref:Uncharacterized protein n=1 Tax=Armillaria novae-zelandiae TaxID=153914 RepID=A0AA39PRL6_9AGAR|nr:hypothetical protein IW261DRAFT_1559018 [Armillaria novae-zelandiae]